MPARPLRAFREAKGLTLEQFGRVFAVDKSTVMRWEDGKIPAERVQPVSKFTGISPHSLRPDLYPVPIPPPPDGDPDQASEPGHAA